MVTSNLLRLLFSCAFTAAIAVNSYGQKTKPDPLYAKSIGGRQNLLE